MRITLGLAEFGESYTNGRQTLIGDEGDICMTVGGVDEDGNREAWVLMLDPSEAFGFGRTFLLLAVVGKIRKTFRRHIHTEA